MFCEVGLSLTICFKKYGSEYSAILHLARDEEKVLVLEANNNKEGVNCKRGGILRTWLVSPLVPAPFFLKVVEEGSHLNQPILNQKHL